MLGRSSVRFEIAQYLTTCINSRTLPGFTISLPFIDQLINTLRGTGPFFSVPAVGSVLLTNKTNAPENAPGVTNLDIIGLQSLTGGIAGLASLALFGANTLLSISDAIAAFTVEAAQGITSPFDEDYNFKIEITKGIANSAAVLNALLEGSNITGKATPGSTKELVSKSDNLVCVHHIHGAVVPIINASSSVIQTELNMALPIPTNIFDGNKTNKTKATATNTDPSSVTPPPVPSSGSSTSLTSPVTLPVRPHMQPLFTTIIQAAEAVDTLITASQRRREGLSVILESSTSTQLLSTGIIAIPKNIYLDASIAVKTTFEAVLALQQRIDRLILYLSTEIRTANEIISREEKVAAEAAVAKEKAKASAAAAREASEAARIAAMTPEDRAKYEADQAKKKAKAAAKEDTPASTASTTKSIPNPLNIGLGNLKVRSQIFLVDSLRPFRGLSPYYPSAGVVGNTFISNLSSLVDNEEGITNDPVERPLDNEGNPVTRLDLLIKRIVESLGGKRRKPRIPKGTRDYEPEQMEVRERCFTIIRNVFKRHGAVEIDTPVFEDKATLLGKYGEEGGKLIYDLADQGGESLSLRYDLTVPFARYLAMHGVENIKRFHIAKVYRRDNPQMARGRYREFYQCDFDVAGVYAPMMPDAEVLKVAVEILSDLPIGDFVIKLNHRKLLDAMLDICGVPSSKFRGVCSAIDKLDKEPWETVKAELVDDKGLAPSVADSIGNMVTKLKGNPWELHQIMMKDTVFTTHKDASIALNDLNLLYTYLQAFNCLHKISFDMSLARGLDYYTGLIYEAIPLEVPGGVPMGSIAAGGRYDNLVGMFSSNGSITPCVGVSIGMERVFSIMEAKAALANGGLKRTPVTVMVCSIPSTRYNMTLERMKILSDIWKIGVSGEMVYAQGDPKLQKQMTTALEAGVPFLVVLAEDELDKNTVQIKNLINRDTLVVDRNEYITKLQELITNYKNNVYTTTTTTTSTTISNN